MYKVAFDYEFRSDSKVQRSQEIIVQHNHKWSIFLLGKWKIQNKT